MKTVDIHCHLQHKDFDKDREKIIEEAKKKMEFIITSGARPSWNRQALELSKKYKGFIYCTLGLHPCDSYIKEKRIANELEFISQHKKEIVGIGECGLDFHWEKESSKRRIQKEVFRRFIELSKDLKLPIITHSWDAEKEVIKILMDEDARKVIMHCFSGKKENLKDALNEGFYISFSTQICFSKNHRKLARDTLLNKILLETDAPWLDPYKKRNLPWNTLITAEKIAKIKKISVEEVLENSIKNAKEIFNLREGI